jgi:hypothetical protein
MCEHLRNTLDALRQNIENNLRIIRKNESDVRKMLENEPVSRERSNKLQTMVDENKKMLEENNDSINLQLSIIKYMEKFNKTGTIRFRVLYQPGDETDLFKMTTRGELEYNQHHPLFDDETFYSKLLKHFIQKEDYESCNKIYKQRR